MQNLVVDDYRLLREISLGPQSNFPDLVLISAPCQDVATCNATRVGAYGANTGIIREVARSRGP